MAYRPTNNSNFVDIELEIQKFWESDNVFKKSLDIRNGKEEFVFYDGPPTANGKPHYGHIAVSAMKDMVCRFKTMEGFHVQRNFGWDCHGLPVEIEVCKERNLPDRDAILDYGIGAFNKECKTDVMKYKQIWIDTVKRIGRWGDFEKDYKTMDFSYMESVMWAIAQLYKKDLLYKGYKVMAYSYGAETSLSNSEAKMDYRDKTDPAVTVSFKLKNKIDAIDTNVLVWTTTPWTLITNLALVVGETIDYSVMKDGDKQYILATALKEKYKKQFENALEVKIIKGTELIGQEYEPMFDYYKDISSNAFKIYSADFVSTEDGTGIVHMAPYGELDYEILKKNNIPMVTPVDGKGQFDSSVSEYAGQLVFDASLNIIEKLKAENKLIKKENYVHSYPYCWRTATPLIYMPMESWFVNVEKIKQKLIEKNKQVNWIPEHMKDGRFGKWLENAMDWGISRNRFWGCPLPIWVSENTEFPRVDVFGSFAEIENASGQKITDPHRPFIDEIVYKNPDDKSGNTLMKRIPDVLDCWFESGSQPFAELHYPFENKELFEKRFPADFIVEGQDQTRGWFYTLAVLGVALFDKFAYKTCMSNGMMLDANKKKLSKSLKNYVAPDEIFNSLGADAFRWFVINSPFFKAESISFDEKLCAKGMREALMPLWNAYHFFTLYANADNIKAVEINSSSNVLDNYILAKLKMLTDDVKIDFDNFVANQACGKITAFMDILNNWYIRRSRDRFWGTDVEKQEQLEAFNTLYTVLVNLTKIMAPIMPHITEYIFKNLTDKESVHLEDWPVLSVKIDNILIDHMDKVQAVCSAGKFIREEQGLRVRLPLKSCTISGINLSEFEDIIKDELNVKQIIFEENYENKASSFLYLITPKIGARLGGNLKEIIPASKIGNYKIQGNKLEIAGYVLNEDEFELRLQLKDGITGKALNDNSAVIILDTEMTDELKAEGIARDFVRAIADLRKEKDFNVIDRIEIGYNTQDEFINKSIEKWSEYICRQNLAVVLKKNEGADKEINIDNKKINIIINLFANL